jgi:hypothetical protein
MFLCHNFVIETYMCTVRTDVVSCSYVTYVVRTLMRCHHFLIEKEYVHVSVRANATTPGTPAKSGCVSVRVVLHLSTSGVRLPVPKVEHFVGRDTEIRTLLSALQPVGACVDKHLYVCAYHMVRTMALCQSQLAVHYCVLPVTTGCTYVATWHDDRQRQRACVYAVRPNLHVSSTKSERPATHKSTALIKAHQR